MNAHQDEPFFITEEIEAETIAAGYVFEPPAHVSTVRLHEILAGLSDAELGAWLQPSEPKKTHIWY